MPTARPYYRRRKPGPYHVIAKRRVDGHVDLRYVHLPPFGKLNNVAEAVRLFDARTAEFVRAAIGNISKIQIFPAKDTESLLELKPYNDKDRNIPHRRCLAALAYFEFFPYDRAADQLRPLLRQAILGAEAGYCGTFGPPPEFNEVPLIPILDALTNLDAGDGAYDLDQMHLLQMAYRYYDDLDPDVQDHLINTLLASAKIARPNQKDLNTSGGAPTDWSRAGHVAIGAFVLRIGETENHILQIHTARYLNNQLLYRFDHDPNHDNRRNGNAEQNAPTCTGLMLRLLRTFLKDDFSEYNAKPYQTETRNALRNLCSYAYDHQVRLGARMVLDYISAHIAVSSCDLRRLVPFRRINADENTKLIDGTRLDVSLLEWKTGADRAAEPFSVLAGNTRAYETAAKHGPVWAPDVRRLSDWSIRPEGHDGMMEGLGDYRLPSSVHDLFVNDRNRRFYQVLHRTKQDDVESGQNADNREIYAGSPSYLITAGGSPAGEAINTSLASIISPSKKRKQQGVAMTTSFMSTGQSAGPDTQNYARDLIQFSSFAEDGPVENYGVAPDFACGHRVRLPEWCSTAIKPAENLGNFSFVNKDNGKDMPGFFLAIYQEPGNLFTAMEAHDTWLHPGLDWNEFRNGVSNRNKGLRLTNHSESQFVTTNGNILRFVIWFDPPGEDNSFGAKILSIDSADPRDRLNDGGTGFLRGTIMNSPEEAKVVIINPGLGQQITLDWSDPKVLRRISETGEVEEARENNDSEVWVDFAWGGDEEGDFFHPFRTIAGAAATVTDGGVIKILPGSTQERPFLSHKKRIRLEAAIGGVSIGVR
jgi:hypothetical protein